MNIGMIGLGTVGQGVADLLRRHRGLYQARAGATLDIDCVLVRDARKAREHAPPGALITSDPEAFFARPFDLLVEVAGGVQPAGAYLGRAIESGRDVVTANKALLAAEGRTIFDRAERARRRVLFEAAVAGGVPVIKAMTESLASNRVASFAGILNGTCNFILTRLNEGDNYEQALREAQRLGYAEADPALDVEGHDSMQKLLILASLAFDAPIVEAPGPIGITAITRADIARVRAAGGALKLIAFARRVDAGVEVFNGPMVVPLASPLAAVIDAAMGLLARGDALPWLFMSGDGAGRHPTASAVVADIIEAARLARCRDTAPLNRWPVGAGPIRAVAPRLEHIAGFPALPGA